MVIGHIAYLPAYSAFKGYILKALGRWHWDADAVRRMCMPSIKPSQQQHPRTEATSLGAAWFAAAPDSIEHGVLRSARSPPGRSRVGKPRTRFTLLMLVPGLLRDASSVRKPTLEPHHSKTWGDKQHAKEACCMEGRRHQRQRHSQCPEARLLCLSVRRSWCSRIGGCAFRHPP